MDALLDIAIKAATSVRDRPDSMARAKLRRLVPLATSHLDYFQTVQVRADAMAEQSEMSRKLIDVLAGNKTVRLGGIQRNFEGQLTGASATAH